ncbi:MAG: aldehyde dehydrogenase [Frankiales bacterium]|nr:aldehyde dehydrogenase [Frankiales bacterium]
MTEALFVDGKPRLGSGELLELRSRRDGSLLASMAGATAADVADAYTSAVAAQDEWAARPPGGRAAVLHGAAQLFRERAGELGDLIAAEMGKPVLEARTEVEKGAAVLDYYAEAGYLAQGATYRTDTGEDVLVLREPLGVVALITPWNFPFTMPIRKVAASLAAGNAALLKPAPGGVLIALAIAQTLTDAGLPAGVLNVVYGSVADVSEALLGDPRLAGVSLTGSYATAAAVRRRLPVEVPLQAELGGKNALVVWRDADVEAAVPLIWQSSFRNNGQICTSAGRLLVHEAVADALLEALRRKVVDAPVTTGDGDFGVLSSEQAQQRIEQVLARHDAAVTERFTPSWPAGLFGPTVLVEPTAAELVEEEIFGPVLTFERIGSLDEAVAKANATAYGLTAGIITNDLAVASAFWRRANAGTVKVNAPLTGAPFHVPMQGFGRSGAGQGEGGTASSEFFTRNKTVHIRRTNP